MKREIKFRAWSKLLNCMSEVMEIDFEHDAIRCVPGHLPKNKLSDCVLLQSTGLKDRNGKEIYERDIVIARERHNLTREETVSVTWDESLAGFAPFANYDRDCDIYTGAEVSEVIGNIYQNPELLNK
jgi:uncharacterized phage protein (TIGR01671 family)